MKNKIKTFILSFFMLAHVQISSQPGLCNLIYQLCTSTRLKEHEKKYNSKINSEGAVRPSAQTKKCHQFIFGQTIFRKLPLDIKGHIQPFIDNNTDDVFSENDKVVLEMPAPGECPANIARKLSTLPLPHVQKYLLIHQANLNKLGSREYLPGEEKPLLENKESIMHYIANPSYNPSEQVFLKCLKNGMSDAIKDSSGSYPWERAILKNDMPTFKRLLKKSSLTSTFNIRNKSAFELEPIELVKIAQKNQMSHANEMYENLREAGYVNKSHINTIVFQSVQLGTSILVGALVFQAINLQASHKIK